VAKRRSIVAALTITLCLGVGAAAAHAATTRYVATSGNDTGGTNACTNSATPCLTIQNAVGHASGGDTIQIGPGSFSEAVSTSTPLSFVGAGAGTPDSFDPSTDTAIDAGGTGSPGLTVSNAQASVQGLRIRGGVFNDGNGGEVEPAIWDHSPSSPTLTVSDCLLLQSNPATPDITDFALLLVGARTVVQDSAVTGYTSGISISGTGGTLALNGSTVVTPAPTSFIVSLAPIANVYTDRDPVSISDSTLIGRTGLYDLSADASITRTLIRASGAGLLLRDAGGAPTLTARDSVIEPAGGGTLYTGVAVSSVANNEPETPAVSLTFDSVLARSDSTAPSSGPAHALDISNAATGTHVATRNTILRALDTSGAGANDDIATGSHAINWDLGHTDYTQTAGPGVPPPGSGTNINALPFYNGVDDLTLAANSPLFDAGDPSVVQAGETDVTGAQRAVAHACGAPALPDLGAYEAPSPNCPPSTVPPPVPSLGPIHATHKTWREGRKPASIASIGHKHERKPPVGTTFTFTLNTAATIELTFTHRIGGRKVKRKCVAPTRHNRHDRACKRTVTAGTLTLTGHAGTDEIRFQGRLSKHRKLAPGTHTLTIIASNTSGRSRPRSIRFRIRDVPRVTAANILRQAGIEKSE
jgi:hypothetical protein